MNIDLLIPFNEPNILLEAWRETRYAQYPESPYLLSVRSKYLHNVRNAKMSAQREALVPTRCNEAQRSLEHLSQGEDKLLNDDVRLLKIVLCFI